MNIHEVILFEALISIFAQYLATDSKDYSHSFPSESSRLKVSENIQYVVRRIRNRSEFQGHACYTDK